MNARYTQINTVYTIYEIECNVVPTTHKISLFVYLPKKPNYATTHNAKLY